MRIGLILIVVLISFSIPACTEIQQVNSDSNNISTNIATLLPQTITRQINANMDDCIRYWDGSSWVWQPYSTYHTVGHQTATATKHGLGLRFANIPILKNSNITNANMIITSRANTTNNIVRSRISGEATNNADAFKNLSDFETRYGNRTKATANWDSIEAWTTDTEYTSPNIKSIIQEIISDSNWISGNALVIFWEDFEGRSDTTSENVDRRSYSYDVNPTKSIRLVISWVGLPTVQVNTQNIQMLPIAKMEDVYINMIYKSLSVELKPTNNAKANYQYTVDLFEKGKWRYTSSITWNQPELNVSTVKSIDFPVTVQEMDAYRNNDLSHIFSVIVRE